MCEKAKIIALWFLKKTCIVQICTDYLSDQIQNEILFEHGITFY